MYLANVKSNYNVILEINDRNYSSNLTYKITFCENQDISYYIPAIKCPKYSKKSVSNNNNYYSLFETQNQTLIDNIQDFIEYNAIILPKIKNSSIYPIQLFISPIYRLDESKSYQLMNQIDQNKKCWNINWWCGPKTLFIPIKCKK